MKIVFLGAYTENKKFFILCMARILASAGTVTVYTRESYSYEEEGKDCYEVFKILVQQYKDGDQLNESLRENPSEYLLIDLDSAINLGNDIKAVALCESERGLFEKTAQLTRELTLLYPFTDIYQVFMGLLEYCKINSSYLQRVFIRHLKGAVNILKGFELYYEEKNRALMLESMYTERFMLKFLSRSFKLQLLQILEAITGLEPKKLKDCLKRSERMK